MTEVDKVVLVKVADEHKEIDPDDKCVKLVDQITLKVAVLVAENDKVELACLLIGTFWQWKALWMQQWR